MQPVAPIYVVELFPPLSQELLEVLRSLQSTDWAKPTVCSPWSVKDVAAHLLGGNLGRLWKRVDTSNPSPKTMRDYDQILKLINQDNDLWVHAAQRISPEILIEFLDLTDRYLYEHFKSLDQDQLASITVAWASDALPPNWFDMAREYTEKWLHQQHIRQAVNQPLLTARRWLYPVLDTFMRGLSRTFGSVEADNGTSISVQITGEAGGEWALVKEDFQWQLFVGHDPGAACKVQIDQDLAWRLFTRGITPENIKGQVEIDGTAALGEQVLKMVSIMA